MHKHNQRLSQRIAQEAQLLAEERWIIETLRVVKQQRNCLQIERLHLENLKQVVKTELEHQFPSEPTAQFPSGPTAVIPDPEVSKPPTSKMPQRAASPEENIPAITSQFDEVVAGLDFAMCNNEKLNLSVTNSVFTNQGFNGFDMEEDEEDMDNGLEDEEDMENALIEMNMLMQAKPC